jgi:hypothetical protein
MFLTSSNDVDLALVAIEKRSVLKTLREREREREREGAIKVEHTLAHV